MSKLLRPRDRILLGLVFAGEILEEIRLVGGLVPLAYDAVYGFVPSHYKRDNFYSAVARLLRTERIERLIVNGEAKLRLSSGGSKLLKRDFPLMDFQRRKWDGKWRILIFDVPEDIRFRRDALRKKLRELGFGMVQKSVWISPHPIEDDMVEFLYNNNFAKYAYVLVSAKFMAGDVKKLVQKIWQLNKLSRKYRKLVNDYQEQKWLKQDFLSGYFDILMQDPFLPRELLPKPWWGNKARLFAKKALKVSLKTG